MAPPTATEAASTTVGTAWRPPHVVDSIVVTVVVPVVYVVNVQICSVQVETVVDYCCLRW